MNLRGSDCKLSWKRTLVAACTLLAVPAIARADKGTTSGPALGIGLGYQSPVVGGQLDYYWLPEHSPVAFAAYFGSGWFPPVKSGSVSSESAFGFAGGAFVFIGHRHRALLDVSYGLGGIEALIVGNTVIRQDTLYGVSAAAGYEFMSSSGFFVRAGFGVTYLFGDLFVPDEARVKPTVNLTLGFKIF